MKALLHLVVGGVWLWFLMGFGAANAQNTSETMRVRGAKQVIGVGIGHQKFGWAPNLSYERSIHALWSIKTTIGGFGETIYTRWSVEMRRHAMANLDLRYYPFLIAGRPMNGPFAGIQTALYFNWGYQNFERGFSRYRAGILQISSHLGFQWLVGGRLAISATAGIGYALGRWWSTPVTSLSQGPSYPSNNSSFVPTSTACIGWVF
jgi:hypothetical protein